MPTKLDLFLNGNPKAVSDTEKKGRKVSKGEDFTHRNYDNMQGWYINSDDMEEFYKLYCDDVRHGNGRHITEKQTAIGQLRVDLDLKYDGEVTEHRHTQEQVVKFVGAYMAQIRTWVQVPETVELYVLEKDYPTFDPSKGPPGPNGKPIGMSSSGLHIQVPAIKVRAEIEQKVRLALLKQMEEFFPNLGCNKDWKDIYDSQPLSHNNNWFLLGSRKNGDGAVPYEIKYAIDWDAETGEMSIDTSVAHQPITVDLVKKFSLRSRKDEESPLTPDAETKLRPVPEATRAVSRGRNPTPTGQTSRSSSPGREYQELDPEFKKYLRKHTLNLGEQRYNGGHNDWFEVCQCLFNIHPDLKDVFDEFIYQTDQTTHPDREAKAEAAWWGCNTRIDGPRLGIRSLRFWSRTDNPEGYARIEAENVSSLVETAADTGTENDVAQVIYAKYRDQFKCASYKNNEWYRYAGHIWRPTENGIELLAKLSSEVAKLFHAKEQEQDRVIQDIGDQCSHTKDKPDLDGCAVCRAEVAKKRYYNLRLRLKTTGFKENVMKECKLLFFDKEFAEKLDDNKHLIAFNNGIYDTLTQTFRPGEAADCISFCTNIDYAVDTQYHEFSCWLEIRTFLESILPNRSVREYFLKHLSTCLSGVFTQRFHILTGSGSNGKSMLMNLCATAFGDYCYKANIAMFTQKRGKAGSAAPELIRMKGKRFVFMSEPDEGEPLSTGFMKEMTSSEKVTGRDLFKGSKEMVEFDVQAKCHLACNDKPKVNTNDGGTWRRLKVIDFPMKFVEGAPKSANELPMDESIMHKVLSKEWAECFMAYLVHLHKEGKGLTKLNPPKEVDAYTQEYKVESDTVARFIQEYVHDPEQQPGDPDVEVPDPVSWSTITDTFREWKRSNDAASGSTIELKKRLETRYGKMRRGGWTAFRFGVGE